MPIIVQKNEAFVVSRSEFIEEYSKLNKEYIPSISTSNFDVFDSIIAITNLYVKRSEEVLKDKFNKETYSFNYSEKEAQRIVLELLVFFSTFYYKIKIRSNNGIQLIEDFLLPHTRFDYKEKTIITIEEGKMEYTFYINQIRHIKGIVNNFIIFFDDYSLHFCSDIREGKFIQFRPYKYKESYMNSYSVNESDYVFLRNLPNRFKLFKYRIKNFLVIIQ